MPNVIDLDSLYRDRVQYPNPCDYTILPSQMNEWVRSTRSYDTNVDQTLLHTVSVDTLTLPYPRIELFADTIVDVHLADNGTATFTSTGHPLADGDIVEALDNVSPFTRGHRYQVFGVAGNDFQLSEVGNGGTGIITPTNRDFDGTVHNRLRFALVKSLSVDIRSALDNAMALLRLPKIYVNISIENSTMRDQDTLASIENHHRNDKFVMRLDVVQNDEDGQGLWLHYISTIPQMFRFKIGEPLRIQISDRRGVAIDVFNDSATSTTYPDPLKQTTLTFRITPLIQDNAYYNEVDTSRISLM